MPDLGSWDLAGFKPSILNALIATLTIIVTLNALKFFAVKFPIPGLSALILNT